LIVPSYDPETIFVPSGEKATDMISLPWAVVFSATQLMSIAIILRTREKKRGLGSVEIRDHKRLQVRRALEGSRRRHATANSREDRGIAYGVWLRSSS
jgi:hypothetical protein